MKKLHFFALMGTAVLTAMVSCSRDENPQDNPNYDPDTEEVKTAFVLNISTAASTKQSSAVTQAGSSDVFRGIKNAYLLALVQNDNGKLLAADANAAKMFDMSDAVTAGTIDATNTRRVFEMSLPLKTNTLLFYGKAPQGEASGGLSANDIYGKLDEYTINTTIGSALFQLGKRLKNSSEWTNKVTQFYAVEGAIVGILTCTMNTHLDAALGTHASINKGSYNLDGAELTLEDGGYPSIHWSSYALLSGKSPVETTHERYELENKLGRLYSQMTNIQSAAGELRAASGEAVLRTIQDLWTIINEIQHATPFSAAEAVAVYFAERVNARLLKYFNATVPSDGSPVTGISYKDNGDIVAALKDDINGVGTIGSFWPSEGNDSKPSTTILDGMTATLGSINIANFPMYFDLPAGATHVSFDDTKHIFFYPSSFNTSGMGGASIGGAYNSESYYYPAELLYFGNSPLRATDTEFREIQYPGGNGSGSVYNGSWTTAASWSAWGTGNFVKSSTRSVAMVNEVNYGNALLQTTVKYGAAVLKDNNHAIQVARDSSLGDGDEPDKEITVTGTTFQLTGVIVGGVHQNVGWDYLPCTVTVGTEEKDIDGFVYDRAIANKAIPASGTSEPNYTMVFDNFKGTLGANGIWTAAAAQDKVYVALEFKNNSGVDFYGNCNIIKNGGYFYLIGELDPAKDGLTPISWPTQTATSTPVHQIPPYNADGTSQQVTRVFIQDFMTKATFTIGPNSLKSAYLTTPDLRSNSMTFGLSVNLEWSTGLDFGEVILGQ